MKLFFASVSSLLWSAVVAATIDIRPNGTITYYVPTKIPSNASVILDAQPIGVSLEFFAFPEYFKNVPSTNQCLQNLADLGGSWPPLRIGGTTQDRATYDPSTSADVTYSVSNSKDAPATLTFGPSFMTLANTYRGKVIIGFNRRLNNLANTVKAALQAKNVMANIYSIELGNEPNFFSSNDPINTGGTSWSASKDFASEAYWQSNVGSNLSSTNIFSAGVYFGTGSFNIPDLIKNEGNSAKYVRDYSSHNYPQGGGNYNLSALMSHSGISSQIAQYSSQIAAANAVGKPHIMGETNSATQGGGGISPTFGAGLWVMDYSLQLLHLGTKALYFHQGTIGNCQYCWWGRYSVGAPYYGAYFASLALAGADRLAPLDDSNSNYAGYVFFKGSTRLRVLLYNSDYYDRSSVRTSRTFTLEGLKAGMVSARRLTAPDATSRQDQGNSPNISGLQFTDGTCVVEGTLIVESTTVDNAGQATFVVNASEALLIELA